MIMKLILEFNDGKLLKMVLLKVLSKKLLKLRKMH